jgi:Ca2+-binding RTX toxin-like protein
VTPPIIGQNVEGQTLSVGTGTWDGTALTFTYSWRRCDPFGNFDTCVAIPGATSNTYVQTSDDIGHALRVWITGTNLAGSDFTITNHTYPTIPKPHFAPSSTTAPQLAGLASVGDPLTATVGTWGGDLPITYAYAWQRCDATGAACRTILGATAHKYTVTRRDIGYTIRVLVTATNAYGKSSAMSDPSDTITVPPKHHRGRRIVGTRGNDYLVGGPYDDVIYGLGGNDTIHGGAGYDTIYGGAGNDVLDGGPGRDHIYGGPGSDTILAADNEPDVIDCGPGNDKATVDAFDVTKNCEDVVVAGSTASPSP